MYKPKDITQYCAFSNQVQFDVTYGMGMSDTITVVFRTLNLLDYQCEVEIAADSTDTILIVVVRYPTLTYKNCMINPEAFVLLKGGTHLRLCNYINQDAITYYFIFTVLESFTFRFTSNSSINNFIDAHFYQVTVTAARMRPPDGCYKRNETFCSVAGRDYCFTSGVVCDGIRNCGVENWYDERKSECISTTEKLGMAPVLALLAFFICVSIAGGHLLLQSLPPLASSFFIFNANEDNRLCIDPKLVPSGSPPEIAIPKQPSIIPVSSSSSSEINPVVGTSGRGEEPKKTLKYTRHKINETTKENPEDLWRKRTKSVKERFQNKIKYVTGYGRNSKKTQEFYNV